MFQNYRNNKEDFKHTLCSTNVPNQALTMGEFQKYHVKNI